MSFALAYRRYAPLLAHKCARMLRDPQEAEDVVQETFLRLHEARLLDADPRVVSAWLYRTSTRLAIDKLRARGRTRTWLVSASPGPHLGPGPDRQLEFVQRLDTLARTVPREELSAALLFRVDGLSQAEVAEVLGVHERSVRRLLARFEGRCEQLKERSAP